MGCSMHDQECFEWEIRRREIRLNKGFWIGQTEVTQQAYQSVTGRNPSRYIGSRRPVDQVSWTDARSYCAAVEMRLPTEAEWEFAARDGSSEGRYGPLDAVAWYDPNSGDQTHEVGKKSANGYGLFDTLGNLWEWVEDAYEADSAKRILRGGSFFNPARDLRVTSRLWATPDTAHRDMGFRCAGDQSPR